METIPMYENLYGKVVEMNDRFETLVIWSKELAIENNGRWKPFQITKRRHEFSIDYSWCHVKTLQPDELYLKDK